MKKLQGLIAVVIILMIASVAQAATINGTGLQNILDSKTLGGTSSVDASGSSNSAIGTDAIWRQTASGGSFEVLMINSGNYSFGIFDSSNQSNKIEIFSANTALGQGRTFEILMDGSVLVSENYAGNFSTGSFGFYLSNGTDFLYSSDLLIDHMVAFQGTGDMFQPYINRNYGEWSANEYVLAWDWAGDAGFGANFTDYVLMVESVHPVPEPSSVLLLGGGLIGLGFAGYRRLQNK